MIGPENSRRILLLKDNAIDYPELWCKVWIEAHGAEQGMFAELFARSRCKKAPTPEEADLVIFGGGADVDPVFYGDKPHPSTHIDPSRDSSDLSLYKKCLDLGIPMIGVCRGAQFLSVMNGGKLFQNVNHHYGEHTMWDLRNKDQIPDCSSVHHQMVKPNALGGMEVIAVAHVSDKRESGDGKIETGHKQDIEAFFYRDTCCFGVQGHPEYTGYPKFTKWFLKMVDELIITNPDISWNKDAKNLRIKGDILGLRKEEWKAKTDATKQAAN